MNATLEALKKAWALNKTDKGILRVLRDALLDSAPQGADVKWFHQQLGEMNFRWKVLAELKAQAQRYERENMRIGDDWRLARAKEDVMSDDGKYVRLQKGEVTIAVVNVDDPEARYAPDGQRLTDCCGAYSTFHDTTLCCKQCWEEVDSGRGDGSEFREAWFLSFRLYRVQAAPASLFEFIDGEVAEDAPRVFEGRPPKVELKKFTCNQRLSEETLAFAAEVFVDGKRAGTVSNHGQGGSCDVHWLSRETEERVERWLRSQISVSNLNEEGHPIEAGALEMPEAYEVTEDFFFADLADDELRKKDDKRIAAKRAKFIVQAKARGSLPFVARLSDRSELFFEMKPQAKQTATEFVASWAAKQKRKVAVVSVEALS